MVNRYKRRSILIIFFFIQIILFSTYTYIYYQNNYNTNDEKKTNDQSTISPSDSPLPASLIEKSDRKELNKNYKNLTIHQLQNDSPTKDELEKLNVSFIHNNDQQQSVIQCPILPTNLGIIYGREKQNEILFSFFLAGRVEADLFSYKIDEIEEHHANLSIKSGGHWVPSHCTARYRVAIIIPYRNRGMQLRIFLNFMHLFLQKQQLDYQIFLIEPVKTIKYIFFF